MDARFVFAGETAAAPNLLGGLKWKTRPRPSTRTKRSEGIVGVSGEHPNKN